MNEHQTAERYPFDYDAIAKGDVFPRTKIEEIVGVKKQDEGFGLKVMSLCQDIMREVADRGLAVIAVSDHGSIRILTDIEAAAYTRRRFKKGIRTMGRAHQQSMLVDMSEFSESDKKGHTRAIEVNSRLLQAMTRERAVIKLEAHKRQTPGIEDNSQGVD